MRNLRELTTPTMRSKTALDTLSEKVAWIGPVLQGVGRAATSIIPRSTINRAGLGLGGGLFGYGIYRENQIPGSGVSNNPFRSDFYGFNPFSWGAVSEANKIDKKIDERNERLWAKHPSGYLEDGKTPIPVNRGSTFSRNGRRFHIAANVPAEQRRAVMDGYDAMHKLDRENGRKSNLSYPSVRSGTSSDSLAKYDTLEAISSATPGNYSIELGVPDASKDSTNWGVTHDLAHAQDWRNKSPGTWLVDNAKIVRDNFKKLVNPNASTRMIDRQERAAQNTGRELNRLMHPDTQTPPASPGAVDWWEQDASIVR